MTREELKRQRQRLKDLDMTILRAALGLQNLVKERAEIDQEGTEQLIEEIAKTLKLVAHGPQQN